MNWSKNILFIAIAILAFVQWLHADGDSILTQTVVRLMKQASERHVVQAMALNLRTMMDEARRDSKWTADLGATLIKTEKELNAAQISDLVAKIESSVVIQSVLENPGTDRFESSAIFLDDQITFAKATIRQRKSMTGREKYVADLRDKLNLVGTHFYSEGTSMALQQIGENLYRYVEVKERGFGMPAVAVPITGDFSQEEVIQISEITKQHIRDSSYGDISFIKPYGSFTRKKLENYEGLESKPGFIRRSMGLTISAIADLAFAPFQPLVWMAVKGKQKLAKYILTRKLSNETVKINADGLSIIKSAISSSRPRLPEVNKEMCLGYYSN